jgi:methylmalonyl-CoA mutase cobalamin-binding domain/chain
MKDALAYLEPHLQASQQTREIQGKVVIGTVKGDIHEIGKSLVATMLSANGFQVYDLGVDVGEGRFIEKVIEVDADILGLSALLTTTMTLQREMLHRLEEQGIRDGVKVLVGGAPVSQEWADQIGADGFAEDAVSAVKLAQSLMDDQAS